MSRFRATIGCSWAGDKTMEVGANGSYTSSGCVHPWLWILHGPCAVCLCVPALGYDLTLGGLARPHLSLGPVCALRSSSLCCPRDPCDGDVLGLPLSLTPTGETRYLPQDLLVPAGKAQVPILGLVFTGVWAAASTVSSDRGSSFFLQVPGHRTPILVPGHSSHSLCQHPWPGAQAAALLPQLCGDHAQRG